MRLPEIAAEALRLALVRPAEATQLASGILPEARRSGEWAAMSTAERAIGVAAMQLNELEPAIQHLRAAVASARRADSRVHLGEARMSLASALVLRGQPAAAFREIDAALHDLDGIGLARALTQRAGILQEMGRVDDALEDYRRALPALRRQGDAQWATRALSNRSLLHVRKRALAHAEEDLLAARRLCEEHGLALQSVYVEHNLGYVKAQRGDVPSALHHYNLAEQGYRRFDMEVGALLVDQAKLLLSTRLVREARVAAEAAVSAYQRQQRQVHLPEAELLLSTVALVDEDYSTALEAAARATRNLRHLGRREWLPLARYAEIQARVAGQSGDVAPAFVRRVADNLHDAGWTIPALDARVLAGRLALQRGQSAAARRDLAMASKARFSGPADGRVRAWLAEALLRKAEGGRRRAAAAVRAGLRVVEDYRATLGATELRAHVSAHRGALADLGLRMSLEDRNPRGVLSWVERARASSLLLRPAHPPQDAALAGYLSELRATMAEIQQHRNAGLSTQSLVQEQVKLERTIRDLCREFPGLTSDAQTRVRSVEELAWSLHDAALVEYVEIDQHLHAVTLVRGRARLHSLGPTDALRHELDHLPFALHRLANRGTRASSRAAASAVLRRASVTFDEIVVRPLDALLADRPLVIVPSASLQSLPWSILPSLTDRPVVVSPSATSWEVAENGRAMAAYPRPVVVVAGPGLDGASKEANAIAELYPGSVLLAGDQATATTLSARIDGADLVHLAAHGAVRSDNPLFSSLVLADGPFTVYDMERLRQAPRRVVLAACDAGRSQVLAGDETLGFAAALLSGGTATLVAPVVPVPDAETVPFMQSYHAHLKGGHSYAEALARAQSEFRSDDLVVYAGAASFVCLGAGLTARAPAASAPTREARATVAPSR